MLMETVLQQSHQRENMKWLLAARLLSSKSLEVLTWIWTDVIFTLFQAKSKAVVCILSEVGAGAQPFVEDVNNIFSN